MGGFDRGRHAVDGTNYIVCQHHHPSDHPPSHDDVLKVAQSLGCARASDPKTLEELFTAKFAEALKTVGKHFNFEQLYTKRDEFKDKIIEVAIGEGGIKGVVLGIVTLLGAALTAFYMSRVMLMTFFGQNAAAMVATPSATLRWSRRC